MQLLERNFLLQRGEIFIFDGQFSGEEKSSPKIPVASCHSPGASGHSSNDRPASHTKSWVHTTCRGVVFFLFLKKRHPMGEAENVRELIFLQFRQILRVLVKNETCTSQFTGKWVKIHWTSWMYVANTDNSYVLYLWLQSWRARHRFLDPKRKGFWYWDPQLQQSRHMASLSFQPQQ